MKKRKTVKKKSEDRRLFGSRLKQTFLVANSKGGFTRKQEITHNQLEQMFHDVGRTINVRPRKGFKEELWKKMLARLEQLEKEVGLKKE